MTTLTVEHFHQLPKSEQAEILAWFERYVCPDRWVIEAELLREGRIALMTVRRNGIRLDDPVPAAIYASQPNHGADSLLTTRIYTTSQPPRCLLRAMLDPREDR